MSPYLKVALAQVKDAMRQLEEAWALGDPSWQTIEGLSAYLGRALENAEEVNRKEQNAREQARWGEMEANRVF